MPDNLPTTSITNEQISREVSHSLSTHNNVSSNAGAVFYEALFKKYLYNINTPTLVGDHYKYVLTTKENQQSEQRTTAIINQYLNQPKLSPLIRSYLFNLLDSAQPIDWVYDKTNFIRQAGDKVIHCEYYMPLREVFATVILALQDLSEAAWPLAKGQTPEAARAIRIREFYQTNKALAREEPPLCHTGVRHSWLQTLDGYQGRRLPLSNSDFLARALHQYIIDILKKDLKIGLPASRDPVGLEREAFETPFKTIFLPWLLQGKPPAPVIEAFIRRGGSATVERYLLHRFRQIGIIPDEQMSVQIKAYASFKYFKQSPCDFVPFLATLQEWLSKYAAFSLDNARSPRQRLVLQVIQWLNNDFNSLAMASSSNDSYDGMDKFYVIVRFFAALDKLGQVQLLKMSAPVTDEKISEAFFRAIDFFNHKLTESGAELDFISFDEMRQHVVDFERGLALCKKDSYQDFIVHFFENWFDEAVDGDDGEFYYATFRAPLFVQLSELYFREQSFLTGASSSTTVITPNIYLDDAALHLLGTNCHDLSAYQMNRILLHALCYDYSHWSAAFYEQLTNLLAFIRSDASLDLSQAAFFKQTYPKTLLKQVDRLISGYSLFKQGLADEAKRYRIADNQQSNWPVLTPALINSAESFRLIRYLAEIPDLPEALIVRLIHKSSGFDVNTQSPSGIPVLSYASQRNRPLLVRRLLAMGAKINHLDLFGESALNQASQGGHAEVVSFLIKQKSDVNIASPRSYRSLHRAAQGGHLDIVDALIKAGADVNAVGKMGSTPLHEAVRNGHLEVVDLLIRQGALVTAEDEYHHSPIYYGILHKNQPIVYRLLEEGAIIAEESLGLFATMNTGHYQKPIQAMLKFSSRMQKPVPGLNDDLRLAALHLSSKMIAELMKNHPLPFAPISLSPLEIEVLNYGALRSQRNKFMVIDLLIPESYRQSTRNGVFLRTRREPSIFDRLLVDDAVIFEEIRREMCSIL